MTAVDKLTEKHGDNAYDRVQAHNPLSSQYKQPRSKKQDESARRRQDDDDIIIDDRQSIRSQRRSRERPRVELPSPERERKDYYRNNPPPPVANDRDFDRQSETSERVLRSYENERDDPSRRPDPSYHRRDMSHGYDDRRPSSQGRSRSRYDDGDSDYDERTGQRYQAAGGRGYDDRRDNRDYDREIIETEVYRGPPRDWTQQRSASYQAGDDGYAVTQYRGNGDLAPYDSRHRSRSRGRRDDDRDDYRDSSRSRDHDRDRDREHEGIRGKLDDTFDKSGRGLGAGLLGAVVGGLAGRQLGGKKTSKRDMVIGAVVGGLAVNAAEKKWSDWKEDKDKDEDKLGGKRYDDRYGDRYDDRYDNRDYRSRSAMR